VRGEPRFQVIRYFLSVKLLLTNDDGIDAPGLAALSEAAARLGDPVVIAPVAVWKEHLLTLLQEIQPIVFARWLHSRKETA